MTIETLQAWLLHKTPVGNTSLKMTFYSREQGVITCIYKGGRLPSKQNSLEPFIPFWLSVNQSPRWHYIRHIEMNGAPLVLKGMVLFSGLYINELMVYLFKKSEASTAFFELYEKTLRALANADTNIHIETLLRRFEMQLLQYCGFGFSFQHEVDLIKPIEDHKQYRFIPAQGFIEAQEGLLGRDILAMGEARFDESGVLKIAKYVMRQAINEALGGRVLMSRRLVYCANVDS